MLTGAIDGNGKVIEHMGICKSNAHLAINQAFEILQKTLEERKRHYCQIWRPFHCPRQLL